jgi:aryl-alcohol dehydrogenase-like predicted oxidoreductase
MPKIATARRAGRASIPLVAMIWIGERPLGARFELRRARRIVTSAALEELLALKSPFEEAVMQRRRLGRTDLMIAPLVLGGNVFGWTVNKTRGFELLDRFSAAGFNAVDTADVYSAWAPGASGGESETMIGDWMRARGARNRVIVITKVGSPMGPGKKGLKAKYIEEAAEASLKRLGADVIDLYLAHWPDPDTPFEETLTGFQRLLDKGKVRFIGASNLTADQLRAALDVAKAKSLPRYEALQPEYNLYDRGGFDGSLRELCMAEEIGVITYFSLAKGFLTGKYRSEADLGKSSRGGGVKAYLNERGRRILSALDEASSHHSASPAEVALAWLMARPGVTAPIASATTIAQLDSLIAAASLKLDAADIKTLDEASALKG